jgi:WD40 repeat protein
MKKVMFSPDGKTLISAGTMLTANKIYNIFLWDIATGQIIGQPLTAHTSELTDIALSPDGLRLASGGEDRSNLVKSLESAPRTVRLWDMKLEDWITSACRVANRNLTRAEWERYFPGKPYHKTCPNLP